ncbi:hypothetical protein RvY_12192 [Ramazzottius varieornatus]|uniref:Helitron helicase-like domain-containing protein n=1 Tax=Ramazzottius varieornatus TaxID=947166 RepID=A0A1D1VL01_RAMVA|nr:hypothetical protein RvY_12192 [Ramazzottius varieornatus]
MFMEQFEHKYQNDLDSISCSIVYFESALRESRQYWYKRQNELTDEIEQLGSPTVLITFSAADLYWSELHNLCSNRRLPPESTAQERSKRARINLIDNPLSATWFLHYRFRTFLEEV